jgi:hypothetical protein
MPLDVVFARLDVGEWTSLATGDFVLPQRSTVHAWQTTFRGSGAALTSESRVWESYSR